MAEAFEKLRAYLRETKTLESCGSVLSWDQETFMPEGGAGHRARQLSALAGLCHGRVSSKELLDLVEAAERKLPAADSPEAALLREARRDHEMATRVPGALVEELAETTALARHAWLEARRKKEFALFRPWLEKIVKLTRRRADALGWKEHPYDALVDEYERGETWRSIDAIFRPLRESLTALLDRILGSATKVDDAILRRRFSTARQAEFGRRAAEAIGFDFAKGRLDAIAAHPFCSTIGPGDVRLTTRYDEHYFPQGFFSTLHEAGHGLYEQGLPAQSWGTPLGEAASFSVHESQSRLWENFVGRSRSFWRRFFPEAQEAFPDALGPASRDDFYRANNDVRRSFIRTEADEVTYNLHIFLRFDLEKALISGDLSVADLPGAWNERFHRDFRMTPKDDGEGCLQDVHWSGGSFGYFPTYTLGNLYAAELWEAAHRDHPDLDASIQKGDFAPLLAWLRGRVHEHGRRWLPRELIARATGRPPTHAALVRHLETKYGEIYGL